MYKHKNNSLCGNRDEDHNYFIINGTINKHNDFFMNEFIIYPVYSTNIYFGPFVYSLKDINILKTQNIETIINLQTHH